MNNKQLKQFGYIYTEHTGTVFKKLIMHLLESNIKYDYDVITKISDEIDALLGHYAAQNGDTVPTFR